MPATKLKEFLESRGVDYVSILHPPAVTATETAEAAHFAGNDFAKTVIVKVDGRMAMVVVPSDRKVSLPDLREMLESEHVELASEEEFASQFPDCELGAMPPFGNLYDLPVYLARSFTDEMEIGFNAGSHREVIKMDFDDFEELVHPIVMDHVTG